jgi:hypothetical protein
MTGTQHENDTGHHQKHHEPKEVPGKPIGTVQTQLLTHRNLISKIVQPKHSPAIAAKVSALGTCRIAIVTLDEIGRAAQP